MPTNKRGRPTECPKSNMIRVRMDEETVEKLDYCARNENSTRSEIIRKSIHDRYDKTKNRIESRLAN